MTIRLARTAAAVERWSFRAVVSCLVPVLWTMSAAGLASAQDQLRAAPGQDAPGTIRGAVTDPSGSVVVGAVVTLETAASTGQRTTITDEAGTFHFSAVGPGNYTVTIAARGFAVWTSANVVARSGENQPLLSAVLRVAPASTQVDVGLPPHELATEQVKAEEKQRLLGVFPHYFVTYEPNPAPLTAAQKFQLGWKTFFDPVPILASGISAGIQQARNSFPGYGQGLEGYGKRFGAQYADRVDEILIGHVVMQAAFHQDPRYFYKGTGSFGSRALYAIATAFVCKGDNGHWQPAYSSVLGGMGAYELSTLYRPGTSRPWLRLSHTVLLGFAGRAEGHLFEQFLLRKLTAHVPKRALPAQPVLRAGTPVSLISVEDLSSKTAENAGPIAFVLASDIQVGGATVAKAGSQAWGRVSYAGGPAGVSGTMHVGLEHVRLTVGKVEVPLRSTQVRGGGGALQYHRLEDSGRIAIALYVDENIALPPAQ